MLQRAIPADSHNSQSSFRADIEGLRALAVSLVILFHFGIKPFRGGFIGVDVFFVISGYLITSMMVSDLRSGSFSFAAFYIRRIRRIAPALVAVVCASLLGGWLLLMPSDLQSLGWQATYASVGLSNIYFITTSGYFSKAADSMPLLHTWSLGIEEQFYLFWPALLFVPWRMWRSTKALLFTVITIASISLCWSIGAVILDPVSAFYLLPSRAWELALGGLMVFLRLDFKERTRTWLDAVGLLLILLSSLILRADFPFPGATALPVCVATAILLAPSQQGSWTRNVLSAAPVRFLGRISYSLYLWHWPVLVFFRTYSGSEPQGFETVLTIAAIILLSWGSYRFIEQPFRRSKSSLAAVGTVVSSVCTLVVGTAIALNGGVPERLPAKVALYDSFNGISTFKAFDFNCMGEFERGAGDSEVRKCLSRVDGRPNVLLIGDSHAAHLGAGLDAVFPDVHFVAVSTSGCKPMIAGLRKRNPSDCTRAFQQTIEKYAPEKLFDAIVIGARWRTGSYRDLKSTVEFLKRSSPKVVVVGPVVEYRDALPNILSAEFLPRLYSDDRQAMAELDEIKRVDVGLRGLLAGTGAEYYSPLEAVCSSSGTCKMIASDGAPMASDYGHLTPSGSKDIFRIFRSNGLTFQPSR